MFEGVRANTNPTFLAARWSGVSLSRLRSCTEQPLSSRHRTTPGLNTAGATVNTSFISTATWGRCPPPPPPGCCCCSPPAWCCCSPPGAAGSLPHCSQGPAAGCPCPEYVTMAQCLKMKSFIPLGEQEVTVEIQTENIWLIEKISAKLNFRKFLKTLSPHYVEHT